MKQRFVRALVLLPLALFAFALIAADNDQDKSKRKQGSRSALKLPPAVINIEDRSEIRLSRNSTHSNLVPEVDRKPQERETRTPVSLADMERIYLQARRRRRRLRSVSRFQLTYGSFDALSALVATERETAHEHYRLSYRRSRREGFERQGSTLDNSQRGLDDLRLGFTWNKSGFEAGALVSFYEEQEGLQANTNYSHAKKNVLALELRANTILSPVADLKFHFRGGKGLFVLDNPANQDSLENWSAIARLNLGFHWELRRHLNLELAARYEDFQAPFAGGSTIRDLMAGISGGMALGPAFYGAVGARFHLVNASRLEVAPRVHVTMRGSSLFTLFLEAERSLRYLDFEQGILRQPFATYTPNTEPALGWKSGGGVRFRFSEQLLLSATLHYEDYSALYVVSAAAGGLFAFQREAHSLLRSTLALKYHLHKQFVLDLEYRILAPDSGEIPYLANQHFSGRLEFSLAGTGTRVALEGNHLSARNNGALPAFFRLDLRLRQTFSPNIHGVLGLDNLLDQTIQTRDSYYQPGITLHGGVEVRF